MITLVCDTCKQEFKRRQSNYKYCSRQCYYKMKKIRGDRVHFTDEMRKRISEKMLGANNPNFGKPSPFKGTKRPDFSGENHPNWKGGYWKTKDGRKYFESIYTNGEKIAEHRKIIEDHIGRKLKSTEIVHHINGKPEDNRLCNLAVCSRAEHMKIHKITNGKEVFFTKTQLAIIEKSNLSSTELSKQLGCSTPIIVRARTKHGFERKKLACSICGSIAYFKSDICKKCYIKMWTKNRKLRGMGLCA